MQDCSIDPPLISSTRKSKARRKGLELREPCVAPSGDCPDRNNWIEEICRGFVSPSKANQAHYRAVLEALWPQKHGIPGPVVLESDLRGAIDERSGKRYHDPFRRIRELQGEEGVTGIARQGKKWQLVSLELARKRKPRVGLDNEDWNEVLVAYKGCCANCGRREPEIRLQQDHKIPRLREGSSDELHNWQPLCDECNNFKSMACRACSLDCKVCGWAFPEEFKLLKLDGKLIAKIRHFAASAGVDPEKFVADILTKFLRDAR